MNQLDVCTHLSDLANLHHDKLVYFRIPLFVIPHLEFATSGEGSGKIGGMGLNKSDSVPTAWSIVESNVGHISIKAKCSNIAELCESRSGFMRWIQTTQNQT